ncbi:hypothetical protein NQ317_019187 [Molorchus minor]|uniref:C2H2-type domain-containing protein n=1 Tax=Molorchus minor TaxID=1323400 RepID=A0ABQ9J5V3_9CUCU|nr:hypothetical protein NQ317_019187 [Molorchus minor]
MPNKEKNNLSITERAVLCSDCSENSHRFFQFKSNCLSTEELIVSFAITENTGIIDVKDVYNKENDSILDVDYVVCRLCINSMKKNFTTLEVAKAEHPILEEMLPKCLPEVDFKITSDPILCTSCLSVLLKYFNFIVKCCDTEKKINTYFEQSGMIKNKLELHKIVHYLLEDKSPILPTEDDYETQIKHESIDIKLEDPETMYQCDICDYNTFDEESLRQHIIAHVINRPGDDQEYADLQKGFNKRQLILDKLRKRVNFNNFNAVDKMGDTTSSHTIRNDHLPCPCCKAFFSRRSMSRHIRMACPEKPQDEPQLLNHQQLMACDVPKLKVFPRMKFNECTRFLRNDKLVLRFADHLLSEKLKKSQMKGVTDKLKLLGNFMLEMKKINPAITDLTSALHPSHYDDMKKSFVIMVQLEKPIKKESIVVSLSEVLRWVAAFF